MLWGSEVVGMVPEVGGWAVMCQGFEAGEVVTGGEWKWGIQEWACSLMAVASWPAFGVKGGQVEVPCGAFLWGLAGWDPIFWQGFIVVVLLLVEGLGSSGGRVISMWLGASLWLGSLRWVRLAGVG